LIVFDCVLTVDAFVVTECILYPMSFVNFAGGHFAS